MKSSLIESVSKKLSLVILLCFLSIPIVFLNFYSQPLFCNCQQWNIANFNIWSPLNSQTLFDPYSLSHLCHGLIMTLILSRVFKLSNSISIAGCSIIETLWEVIENSPAMIERYRKVTIAIGYSGDSVVNSMSDLLFALIGSVIVLNLRVRLIILLVVVLELTSLIWIKDNLTLNVLMLLYPVPEIAAWQKS